VGRVSSTKAQLPILSTVLIKTEKGRLLFVATNLETTISFWIGATVEEEGAIAVPARLLIEVVSSLTDEKTKIRVEKNSLILEGEESEASLNGLPEEEFPPRTPPGGGEKVKIKKEELKNVLSHVLIAVSTDESRPILTGVKIVEEGQGTVFAATDGYRLSVKKIPSRGAFGEGVLVPAKALGEVVKLLDVETSTDVGMQLDVKGGRVVFSTSLAEVETRLIEGVFPAYEKIIPSKWTTKIQLRREEFTKAVRLAQVYAKEAANIVKLIISEGKMIVTANSPQVGENKTTLQAAVEGEGGEVCFNSRFLLDYLNSLREEEVVLETGGPLAPGLFRVPGDEETFHIIMPVRVQN
jgi:DNA polymerase-3 subunit beta